MVFCPIPVILTNQVGLADWNSLANSCVSSLSPKSTRLMKYAIALADEANGP